MFSISDNQLLLRLKLSIFEAFLIERWTNWSKTFLLWLWPNMGKVHFCRQALVALLCRGFEFPLLEHFHHRFISLIGWDEDNKRCQMCFQLSEKMGEIRTSLHAFFCFLTQLRFRMGMVWMSRWNGLKILILKHMWKSKIRLIEQK